MAFATRSKVAEEEPSEGIVYLMQMTIDDVPLVKIGITSRSVYERLAEILISFTKVYRYSPHTKLLRFSKVDNYKLVEQYLHRYYKEASVEFEKKFSGSTEFFMIDDVDELKEHYDYIQQCDTKLVEQEWLADNMYVDGEKDSIQKEAISYTASTYTTIEVVEKSGYYS